MSEPTVIPEVAFSTGAGETGYLHLDDPSRGKLDTAKLGPVDTFVAVTEWFGSATVSRGVASADGVYGRAEAGRATLRLRNEDRRFDPTNLAGPYVAAGVTQVLPMRAFRLRAIHNSISYNLFRGFADAWILGWPNRNLAEVELVGTDGTKVVANYDGLEGGVVGTGEDTGARIGRLLTNAGWPAADRDLDAGKTTVQGTNLSSNAWTEIALTSDTEIGEVYFDGAGKVVFRNRHAIFTDTRSVNSQATFGDAGGELGYTDLQVDYSDAQVKNVVRVSRVGGTTQTAEDLTSQTRYMKRTWQRFDLIMQTDTEAADYAAYVLSLQKDAELRVASLTVNPYADETNLFPQVLGRELGDRITVKFTPPGGGARISRDAFIRGITHDIGPKRWVTTWVLQDATTRFAFLVLDHATLGRLDNNALAY